MALRKMILEATQKIPLTLWKDGTIRVKGSRLLVDAIVNAHNLGQCPEEIFDSFPSESYAIADIYLIIAYYLRNKSKIDKYIAGRERKAKEIRKEIEESQNYQEKTQILRNKILDRWKNNQK